jgi:phosphate transport system substrate-binding protein
MFYFKKCSFTIISLLSLFFSFSVCAEPVNGAGSSAAQPLYHLWALAYNQKVGVDVEYDAIGSSAGIKKIKDKAVDFGASDVALNNADLQQYQMIQFPSAISGIVPVINLPGLRPGELKLTGPILASIFSHQITKWNDEAIAALNPTLNLPKAAINVIARSDGSGSTYNFTDYLSRVSLNWKGAFGTNFVIKWPAEVQLIKGSGGVAAAVKQTANSISYIDYNYVVQDKLSYAQLRNAEGNFVSPTPATFESALNHSSWKTQGNFNEMLTEKPGANTWPITMGTFVIMPKVASNVEKTVSTLKFFSWGFMQGDRYVTNLDFVHLPDPIQAKIYMQMMTITNSSGQRLSWSPM